jgi:CelD/BcsL family acetyltransferase involved in cellulose biosynthesis
MTVSRAELSIEARRLEALGPDDWDAWEHLLAQAAEGGAFFSPCYTRAVHATLGVNVCVVLFRRGDELVGVMPLQRAGGWLGRCGLYEPIGGVMTDYFGLIASPGVQTSWRALLRASGIACLHYTHLDETQQRHGLSGHAPRKGLRTVIHAGDGAAHWQQLRTQDKKLVSDTERRERKLIQDHGALVFRLRSDRPREDLEGLIRLKKAQYLRTGHPGASLFDVRNVSLLQHLLDNPSSSCVPLLSTLTVGTRLVAAHLGMAANGVLHYWFPVYDEAFSAYSPGRILFKQVLLAASEHGIRTIDRGEGDTQAKRDFATESHLYFRGLVSTGIHGRLLEWAQRLQWRLMSRSR